MVGHAKQLDVCIMALSVDDDMDTLQLVKARHMQGKSCLSSVIVLGFTGSLDVT